MATLDLECRPVKRRLAESKLADAYREFLATIPGGLHSGTMRTPERAVAALRELTEGYDVSIPDLFTVFEPDGYEGMVVGDGFPFVSLCEHHLLPVEGVAHVVYLAGEKVLGFSKLPRVVRAFASRLQQQERMTVQIADAIEEHLKPRGVMVVVAASHACMRCRGVRSDGTMKTSTLRGVFKTDAAARQEAEWLIAL